MNFHIYFCSHLMYSTSSYLILSGDGAISVEADMEATKETCLATCFKRNAFKKLFFPDCTE